MDAQLRRVVHLEMRSCDAALNRRGAILIEDALRTATMPDEGGSRLVVIRKLDLGRIRANEAPSSIALRIEKLCASLAAQTVHATSPDADRAPAVYFHDEVEPYTLLALRISHALSVTGWFWPLAARGWKPGMPRDEAIRVLLAGALACNAGTAAALAWVRALVRHGVTGVLAGALRHQDGVGLLRAFGWAAASPISVSTLAPRVSAKLPSSTMASIAAPWFHSWGETDPRAFWFACTLCAIEFPGLVTQPEWLASMARAWLYAEGGGRGQDGAHETPGSSVAVEVAPSAQPVVGPLSPVQVSQRSREGEREAAPDPAPARPPERVDIATQPGKRLFTSRAGLFFLVSAMERLGMAAWLKANRDLAAWDIPYRILQAIALRFETLPGDPVLAAIGELPENPPSEVEAAVADWIRRLRRYSRKARIGLHALVCRPGRMACTETHWDVLLRLDAVDMRVRRAGFDLDPSWVPWLARVIRFHYVTDEAYDG
jgi:hypothetical protein